jgi:hypothetical protein
LRRDIVAIGGLNVEQSEHRVALAAARREEPKCRVGATRQKGDKSRVVRRKFLFLEQNMSQMIFDRIIEMFVCVVEKKWVITMILRISREVY